MKRKIFRFTAAAFLIFNIIIFSGCPEDGDEEIDPALIGSWSNEKPGVELKTFKIEGDGSFTATLSDPDIPGRGTVTGFLIKEGSDYMMNKMEEKTGIDWGSAVSMYNGKYVQISIYDYNLTFDLKCKEDSLVETFFGGIYHKQQ